MQVQQTSDNGAPKETSAKSLQSLGISSHQEQEDVAMVPQPQQARHEAINKAHSMAFG